MADLALVEGGLLADYLDQRGALWPPDEAALVEQWIVTPLALYEVLATRPGRELTVRTLPDGPPVVVRDRAMSGDVERFDLMLGRLLPDGAAGAFLTPPSRVPRERRAALLASLADLDLDVHALAAALAPAGPPELVNREGEPILICTAHYADIGDAWARLAAELEDEDGVLVEFVDVDVDGDHVIRGYLHQVADGLQIEANSLERLRRLQDRVLAAAPDARLVSESHLPPAEAMAADLAAAGEAGSAGESGLPPEVEAELLATLAEQTERRWLDESIPALGGLTPRQAAADPATRAELEALLDDFAWRERQTSALPVMQAGRLRQALGLPAS